MFHIMRLLRRFNSVCYLCFRLASVSGKKREEGDLFSPSLLYTGISLGLFTFCRQNLDQNRVIQLQVQNRPITGHTHVAGSVSWVFACVTSRRAHNFSVFHLLTDRKKNQWNALFSWNLP